MERTLLLSLLLTAIGLLGQVQKPVDPLNRRDLIPFLIDIPGYKGEKPEGSTTGLAGLKVTIVSRGYTKGDNSLRIEITDGSCVPMASASFRALEANEIDTSEELLRKMTIQGFPAMENIRFENKHASVLILIAERFLINIEGEGFKDTSKVKEVAEKIDLKKLEKLAK
ncbi:MAG: hypothetical protein AB1715_02640 [Acidobacteriota bacterium]